ncbi:MAG: hypothetical protein ACKE51_09565 [Methylococcaceae bacterium]
MKTLKQHKSVANKQENFVDSRFDYLMPLNSDWIAAQNNTKDVVRSIN